jgi:hypothetical protein
MANVLLWRAKCTLSRLKSRQRMAATRSRAPSLYRKTYRGGIRKAVGVGSSTCE